MSVPAGKAYSYIRFSSPEQAKGDSKRRQTGMAEEWAKAHGLPLDKDLNMSDLGVSGYRGKNLEGTAKLGAFLAAVKAGDVPKGSVLLVEALDRITRKSANRAAAIVQEIVDAGVDVVTLNDGKRYTAAGMDDGMDYLFLVILAMRAHDESKNKGRRVAAAWANKRARKAGSGYGRTADSLTNAVPGWIARDGSRQLIPERAAVVRRIFEMYTAGMGKHAIASTFNAENKGAKDRGEPLPVPTWGIGKRRASMWHQSYISKILHSETVIGVMTPHTDDGTTRTPQAPIQGYYPAAIERELWDRAQSMLGAGRTRVVASRVQNILAGLAKCPLCGGSMTRVAKGSRSRPKLVCASAKSGGWTGCKYVSVSLADITAALVHTAKQPWPSRTAGLDDAIKEADAGLEATLERLDATVQSLEAAPTSKTLLAKLAELEAAAERSRGVLAGLQAQASQTETRLLQKKEARYRAALGATPLDVAAANAVLKECLSKVVVDHTRGVLVLAWKHNGETEVDYTADAKQTAVETSPGFDPAMFDPT